MSMQYNILENNPYEEAFLSKQKIMESIKPSLLLHSCCGPCSSAVIERLTTTYNITVFFYNPNITDEEEYSRRLDSQKLLVNSFNQAQNNEKICMIEGTYEPKEFLDWVYKYKNEKEGGRRCEECFILRLSQTALTAKEIGFDFFATTLTVSPHKNYEKISQIGNMIAFQNKLEFLDMNFKKNDGYRRSIELAKKYNLYRQQYCGCEYSFRPTNSTSKQ